MRIFLKIVFSAFCLYLAFPNIFNVHGFWPLAWFFAIPLFDVLENKSFKQKLWIGFLSGVITYGFLVQWLWPVHKIGTAFFVLALCIQTIIFCSFFLSFKHSWAGLIYVPALWAVSEFVRTLILQGFCWSIGYSQSFHPPLIQLAAWTGPYGISFLIIFVNYCLFRSLKGSSRRALYLGLALMVFAGTYIWGAYVCREARLDQTFSVCAIQPNISVNKKHSLEAFDNNIEAQVRLTEKAVALQAPHFIVWPETAFAADVLIDRVWYPRLAQVARDHNVFFLLGAAPMREGRTYNSAILLNPQGNTAGIYDKQFLVPISEQIPSKKWLSGLMKLFRFNGVDFTPGSQPGIMRLDGVGQRSQFGVMICSEVCYPSLVRKLSAGGADFAVVILNDGWFVQPAAIMMHAQNTIMRAVEAGFDIVSVGNTGLTARVNRQGIIHIKEELPLQQEAYGTFYVSNKAQPTVYARIGDFFAVSCLLFVIIIFVYQRRMIVKKR